MELKYKQVMRAMGTTSSSNRTFMELKLATALTYSVENESSNRTFMELKWLHRFIFPRI